MERNGLPDGQRAAAEQLAKGSGAGVFKKSNAEKVTELEAEVHFLARENAVAADKLRDYEEELRRVRAQVQQQQSRQPFTNGRATPEATEVQPLQEMPPPLRRFPSFMQSRKTAPTSSQSATARENELQAILTKEQSLRQAAEAKVKEVNDELEELSQSLFQEANEMVASERKENAKLAEKLKTLEMRDGDRKRRLEKLEAAMSRIDRVKKLLAP